MNKLLSDKRKVIFIDFGNFIHSAIFSQQALKLPATYVATSSILACLNRIELNHDDIFIVALDSPIDNWRKEIDSTYQSNRFLFSQKGNWKEKYIEFVELLENCQLSTPFHVIEIDKLEANDIIAYGVRFYENDDCIIISTDLNLEQLVSFQNVRIFSPRTKKYKIVKNPHKFLAKKINQSIDSNIVTPIYNIQEYKKVNTIVNLLSLPQDIETTIYQKLASLTDKEYDINTFRFGTLKDKFMEIFNNNHKKIVEVSQSFKHKKVKSKQERLI
jgi:hypothetical protein